MAQVVRGTVSGGANAAAATYTSSGSLANNARPVQRLPLNGRLYDQFVLFNPNVVNYSGQHLAINTARDANVVTNTYSAYYVKRDGAQTGVVTGSGAHSFHGSVYEYFRNDVFNARNYFDSNRVPKLQVNNFGATLGGPLVKRFFLFGNYESYRQNRGITAVALVPDNQARAGLLPDANGVEKRVTVNPVSARLLNLWPVQNRPEVLNGGRRTGIALFFSNPEQRVRVDSGATRLDANLGRHDSAFASYSVNDSDGIMPGENPYSVTTESLRLQRLRIEEQHSFSEYSSNTASFTFSRAASFFDGYVLPEIQAVAPTFIPGMPTGRIVVSGSVAGTAATAITNAGTTVGSNNAVAHNAFTFDDHVVFSIGKHQIEAGAWLQRLQSNDALTQAEYGSAAFNSLENFLAGSIRLFRLASNHTPLNWRNLFVDAYIEDTFRVIPRLQIRAGFRSSSMAGWSEANGRAGVYSMTNGVLSTSPTVQSHVVDDNRARFLPEPRLGLVWDVFGKGSTTISARSALFHSLLTALPYRLDNAAPFNTLNAYTNTFVAAPTATTPQVLPSNVAPGISTPALFSYSLRVEQKLSRKTILDLSYVGSHTYHQILAGDLNEPAFTVLPNRSVYYPAISKANPQLASTLTWWSGGSGNYNAMVAELRTEIAHGFQLRTVYTWSKNLDNGAAWTTTMSANSPAFVSVPQMPRLDYGPTSTDLRNVFSVSAQYELPFGKGRSFLNKNNRLVSHLISDWSLSVIGNLQSGFAFSPQLGYNPTGSGDPRNPVRPDVNPNFSASLYSHGTTAERVAQFFDPKAFLPPAYGTVGNVRRNSLVGPGHANWDISLFKEAQLSKRAGFQFRADIFNVLNHTNLQVPNEIVYANGPAQGAAAARNTAVALGPGGHVTGTADSSRQMQFSVRLAF